MFLNRRGFTLVELLLVIVIIAVLAAILFPVFTQVREKARQTACLSNMKQIGNAILLYAQDYDETLVPAFVRTGQAMDLFARRDYSAWPFLIQPYIQNGEPVRDRSGGGKEPTGAMRCPSFDLTGFLATARRTDCYGPAGLDAKFPARQYYAHYGIGIGIHPNYPFPRNTNLCGTAARPDYFFAGTNLNRAMTLPEVRRHAESAIVTDGFTGVAKDGAVGVLMGCPSSERHQGGANLVFLDGHARWFSGNAERHTERDDRGCYYRKYFTIDR